MRLLRNVLLALFGVVAVIGGVFVALGLVVAGTLTAVFNRLLRPAAATAPRRRASDVIDVTATEVRAPQLQP